MDVWHSFYFVKHCFYDRIVIDIIWGNVMKKIFCLAVFCALVTMPVWAQGTGDMSEVYCLDAGEEHPVGSKRDADSCGEGIDPSATKCEYVCVLEAEGSKKAKWIKFVKECKTGMKPGRYREYGHTMCELDSSKVVGKCHPSVCTSELCKACCAKPSLETIWTPSIGMCLCVNGGNFVKEGNEYSCKISGVGENPDKDVCDSALLGELASWKTQCADFAEVLTEITALEEYCSNVPDKDVFLRLYDDLNLQVKETCVAEDDSSTTIVLSGEAATRIEAAVDSLRSYVSDLEDVSKWKTADGKFNTARLASDSIAGVVLGTAGGLITSNVVKKHQVEDGFEDLQCVIGGQTVAGWGDEFTIGVH